MILWDDSVTRKPLISIKELLKPQPIRTKPVVQRYKLPLHMQWERLDDTTQDLARR